MKVATILLTIASLALASPIVKRADDISARFVSFLPTKPLVFLVKKIWCSNKHGQM